MRRGRLLILLALVLLFGVVAAFLFLNKISLPGGGQVAGQGTPGVVERVEVVIAAQDIARGSKIPEDGVIMSPFPADAVVETMMTDRSLVVGRYARMDIARGIPITLNMLTERTGELLGTGSEAAVAIPPGYTAMAVPMARLSSVAYALRDGDKVDVIVTMSMLDLDVDFQSALPNETLIMVGQNFSPLTGMVCNSIEMTASGLKCTVTGLQPFGRVDTERTTGSPLYVRPTSGQYPRIVSQRLLSNATILHVGNFALPGEEKTGAVAVPGATPQAAVGAPVEGTPQAPIGLPAPDVITLIVTPQDALALTWALKSNADISFTLRAPGDTTATETTSVTLKYLLDNYNITVPTKLPYGLVMPVPPVLPNETPPIQPTGP